MSRSFSAILSTPSKTDFLVLRHAEVHNPRDILYGRLPRFRLSERGREQALLAARFLSARPVVAIYTSPMLRARQTAAIVSAYQPDVKVHTARALLEVRSSYQGSPNSIMKPGFSFYEPLKDAADETMADVFRRVIGSMRKIGKRHLGETVVLVSHADPIAIMRIGLEGRELTAANLHTTVYPARASLTHVVASPHDPPRLSYFDIVGDGPT